MKLSDFMYDLPEERIAQIASKAEGFVYVVPGHEKKTAGVISNGECSSVIRELSSITEIIRRNTDVPCAIFCETGEKAQLTEAAAVSDGIIVEETVVSLLAEYGTEAPARVGEYVRSLKEVL